MKIGLAIAALCVFLGTAPPARADIYMYRDGKGALHFSNAPARPGYRRYSPGKKLPRPGFSSWLSPARQRAFDAIIAEAAGRYQVDIPLIKGVIRAESNFVPYARSPKGALGLMQLMPSTAKRQRVQSVLDPRQNVQGGVRHLRMLLDRYSGNVRLALAAYNAGSGAVERYGGVPPFPETIRYVEQVLRYREEYLREH